MLASLFLRFFLRFVVVSWPWTPVGVLAQQGAAPHRFVWAWVLVVALGLLLSVTVWSWIRASHPARKLGP